jgi:hypothetical protein
MIFFKDPMPLETSAVLRSERRANARPAASGGHLEELVEREPSALTLKGIIARSRPTRFCACATEAAALPCPTLRSLRAA